ncbi:MAG TPA: choice-of-anchor tandem repeat GloVer-containing protein [Puia sp.]|nr:choice-of-anchor tandem repeat GloVer-containing protein [Puia sp.]
METKTQTNWLSGPAGVLLLLMTAFTLPAFSQDRYFGLGSSGNSYQGDIFSINTDGSNPQQVFSFDGSNTGGSMWGNLILHNGLLYGTTRTGAYNWNGLGYNNGTIFSYNPYTNTQTVLYAFTGGSDGTYTTPNYYTAGGQLTEYPDGKLYGATTGGGNNGFGTIFSWDPAAGVFTKVYDLPTGTEAISPLTLFDFKLYGESWYGGASGNGFLFSFDPRSGIFTDLFDFGQNPTAYTPMVSYQNKLYGVAAGAGPYNQGIIFSYDPVSGQTAPVYSFDGTHGGNPYQIMVYNNKFYGTTQYGGAYAGNGGSGVLFSFDPATGKYTDLHDDHGQFSEYQGFVIDSSGKMSGIISGGGFFQYDLNSNTYTESDLSAFAPIGGLVFVPGNNGTAAQTLTFNALPPKTYGDMDFPGGATATSGLPVSYSSNDLTVAWTAGDQIHIVGAGTCTITATQQGNSVYAPASATQTLTVAPANLQITAADTVKYQYAALPVFRLIYTGLVNGDSATSLPTPPTVTTTATINSPQGQYPIIPSGAASNNYSITYEDGSFTVVGQAQDISFTDTLKTYGDADFATAIVNTGLSVTYSSSNPAVAIITAAGKIHITGAGTDTITISQAGNTDYGPTSIVSILHVLPASLSISVNNDTSIYRQTPPTFSAVYTGLVNGDTPDSLQTVFSSTGSAANAEPGVYLIYVVGIRPKDSVNYQIVANVPGSLLITPAEGDNNSLDTWFSSQATLQVNVFTTTQTPEGQHVVLQLFDVTGRPCVNMELSLQWGLSSLSLPVPNLPAGVYIVRVAGEAIKLTKTITKLL